MYSGLLVRILIPVLIGIVILIVMRFILTQADKEERDDCVNQTSIIVYLPRAYFWVGLVDSVVFLIFIILATFINNETTSAWVFVLFSAFLLLGVFLMLETLMWKIKVFQKEDYFIYNSIFCKNKKIFYKDCIKFRCTTNELIVYAGKRIIFIDMFSINYNAIYIMLVSKKVKRQ